MAMFSFLDRERTIAHPGYNRWRIPTAALAIHLAIGQAYAFSVFDLPLSKEEGWKLSTIGWVFSIAIVFLGVSAALFGKWLERVGPRRAISPPPAASAADSWSARWASGRTAFRCCSPATVC